MTKRIIAYVLTALLLIAFFSVILSIQATTNVIGKRQESKLVEVLEVLFYAHERLGNEFIESFETEDYSITLIRDGVIIHGDRDVLENSSDQSVIEEFLSDIDKNPETIINTSSSYLFGNVLLSGIKTSDETVIIVSTAVSTFTDTIVDVKMELMYIILVCVLLSTFLARLISYLVVQPLNEINIEAPTEEDSKRYKEILPLLNKITEQKEDIREKEEELQRNEGRFYAISESLQEGMVLIEAENRISYINTAAIRILNLRENPKGRDYRELFGKEVCAVIEKTEEEGNQTSVVYNSTKAYQVETTNIILPDGNFSGIAMLVYDVTERMALERDRRDFTANVSHELKTPLHVITGSAELLELGIVKEDDQKVFINQIYTESKRMARLIEDIIKLSRLDDNNGKMESEVIDVMAVCEENVENVRKFASENNISLSVSGDYLKIRCNGPMFSQIIYNLLTNAIKYNNPGGKVDVIVHGENGMTLIDVSDNGIGIPEESQGKIFERFYCVDKSRSRKVGGTGLGLAIVKSACTENGGDVVIYKSAPGEGTTFRVSFPTVNDGDSECTPSAT